MNTPSKTFFLTLLTAGFLSACGGGGGGSSITSTSIGNDVGTSASGSILSFEADIEPIMQAKCLGCHNDGDNPVASFSLAGRDKAETFKSAIQYSVESNTMPPPGTLQLTGSERAKLLAWASGKSYNYAEEILRISLVDAAAWATQPKNRDSFLSYRPDRVTCEEGEGWLVEGDELEVRTEFCNYLSVSQNSLLELAAGTEIELALSHSALDYNAPSEAHLGLAIGGSPVWETTVAIPSDSAILKPKIVLPFAISRGDSIEFQVSNHGNNTYTFYDLIAVVSSDTDLTECASFDSTFEAIQATVFAQTGCANSLCHAGPDAAGGLDLSPDVAWANLVDVKALGSSLSHVEPRNPSTSYLYHKLSEKTFPGSYDIAGAPMPSAGAAISAGQLEAIRLWIEAGAPETGSVGDTLGRGEDEIERLLGVCLPEAEAVNTVPLPAPAPDKGIQFVMPAQDVPAESEREVCFAVYKDFRNDIPEEFLSEDRETFYTSGGETREDAFTHHNLIYKAPVGIEALDDPSFGEWICGGGEQDGDSCDPRDLTSCGAGGPSPGQCHAEMQDSIACRGYGPEGVAGGQGTLGLGAGIEREGFYSEYPSYGVFYWNSHAFNLTTEDGTLRVWRNINFATDRRFAAKGINDVSSIFIATGVPPFEKRTLCSDYVFDQGDGLLAITSHTHKRGERFFMDIQGEELYETFTYDEPLYKTFEPAMVFNSPDPKARTLTHCATYNNGVNADGSPNTETVVRLSRRPVNARPCRPTACVAGDIGASCNGPDDDASCNASPGSGACDACAISGAFSSDDEMFILIGSKLPDHDMQMNAYMRGQAEVVIIAPEPIFEAGDVVDLEFVFKNFELLPPEDHVMDGDMDHDMGHDSEHSEPSEDHASVTAGHYHVYFNTDDDSADHVTAWSPTVELPLPMDVAPGSYEIRISLRAPDHHATGVEDSVSITIQ
ncbi:MAG: hypothetical protein P8J17_18130 [Halioglobus sp.]|nr:hypothetical protein [Halioglobus sp.]